MANSHGGGAIPPGGRGYREVGSDRAAGDSLGSVSVKELAAKFEKICTEQFKKLKTSELKNAAEAICKLQDGESRQRLEQIVQGQSSAQSKADALRSWTRRQFQIELIQVDPRMKKPSAPSDGSWKVHLPKERLVPLTACEMPPEALTFFAIEGDDIADISFGTFDEIAKNKTGLCFVSMTQLETVLKENFGKPTEQPMACLVQMIGDESKLGGSPKLHEDFNIARASFLVTPTGEEVCKKHVRHCWLVNFGQKQILFTPIAAKKIDTGSKVELQIRANRIHVNEGWFDSVVDNPVKLMNLSIKEVWPIELVAGCEPISVAFKVKPRKPTEVIPDVIRAFVKVNKSDVLKAFSLAGVGGLTVSAAGGVKDQTFGVDMIPLPGTFEYAGDDNIRELKTALGEAFMGVIPINDAWSRFGVRVLKSKLIEAKTELCKLYQTDNQLVVNNKFSITCVPKGVDKKELVKVLQDMGWNTLIMFELRGRGYQTRTTTSYVLGATDEPPMSCVYLEGVDEPLEIERFQKDEKATSKEAGWVGRVYMPEPTPNTAETVKETEQVLQPAAVAATVMETATPKRALERLGKAHLRLKVASKPIAAASSSEEMELPAKKPCARPTAPPAPAGRSNLVDKSVTEAWVDQASMTHAKAYETMFERRMTALEDTMHQRMIKVEQSFIRVDDKLTLLEVAKDGADDRLAAIQQAMDEQKKAAIAQQRMMERLMSLVPEKPEDGEPAHKKR